MENPRNKICLCLCKKKKEVKNDVGENKQLLQDEINKVKMTECVICLETLETNREFGEPNHIQFYKTFCNHKFHYKCLNSWILNVKQ